MATSKIAVVQGPAKFGLLFHPTPETAKIIARVVLYGAAVVNFILATFPNVPESVKGTVGQYSTWAVGAGYFICHLWGIEPEGPTNVSYKTTR